MALSTKLLTTVLVFSQFAQFAPPGHAAEIPFQELAVPQTAVPACPSALKSKIDQLVTLKENVNTMGPGYALRLQELLNRIDAIKTDRGRLMTETEYQRNLFTRRFQNLLFSSRSQIPYEYLQPTYVDIQLGYVMVTRDLNYLNELSALQPKLKAGKSIARLAKIKEELGNDSLDNIKAKSIATDAEWVDAAISGLSIDASAVLQKLADSVDKFEGAIGTLRYFANQDLAAIKAEAVTASKAETAAQNKLTASLQRDFNAGNPATTTPATNPVPVPAPAPGPAPAPIPGPAAGPIPVPTGSAPPVVSSPGIVTTPSRPIVAAPAAPITNPIVTAANVSSLSQQLIEPPSPNAGAAAPVYVPNPNLSPEEQAINQAKLLFASKFYSAEKLAHAVETAQEVMQQLKNNEDMMTAIEFLGHKNFTPIEARDVRVLLRQFPRIRFYQLEQTLQRERLAKFMSWMPLKDIDSAGKVLKQIPFLSDSAQAAIQGFFMGLNPSAYAIKYNPEILFIMQTRLTAYQKGKLLLEMNSNTDDELAICYAASEDPDTFQDMITQAQMQAGGEVYQFLIKAQKAAQIMGRLSFFYGASKKDMLIRKGVAAAIIGGGSVLEYLHLHHHVALASDAARNIANALSSTQEWANEIRSYKPLTVFEQEEFNHLMDLADATYAYAQQHHLTGK